MPPKWTLIRRHYNLLSVVVDDDGDSIRDVNETSGYETETETLLGRDRDLLACAINGYFLMLCELMKKNLTVYNIL